MFNLLSEKKIMELFEDSIDIKSRIKRPYGEITSKGNYESMLIDAKEMAKKLSEKEGVLGITLCGGLSRGYTDDLSEIDLIIYLDDEIYNEWIIGLGPVPQGDMLWDGKYYDLKFYSYQKELLDNWSLVKRWDASYNKILYDPEEKIVDLLKSKDIFRSQEKFQSVSNSWQKCIYIGTIVIKQWINRGDPTSANYLLNKAIPGLVELAFIANDEYVPYEKWDLNYSYSLKWLPKDWKNKISKIILVNEISFQEAERRHKILMDLYNECWEKIFGKDLKDLEPIDITTLFELQFIVDNSPVSLEKFSSQFEKNHLSFEPHFKITDIIIKDGKKFIVFNKEKYNKYKETDFSDFLIWNKRSLKKLKVN